MSSAGVPLVATSVSALRDVAAVVDRALRDRLVSSIHVLAPRMSAAPLRVPAFQEADLPLAWLVRDCEFRRCRVLRGELAGMSLDGGDAAPVTLALLPPARLVMRLSREAHAVCGLDARRAAGDESAYIVDVDLRAVGERAAGRLAACFERLLPIARMRLAWVGTDEPGADPLAQRALVGEALCAGGVAVRQLAGVVAPALGPECAALVPPAAWHDVALAVADWAGCVVARVDSVVYGRDVDPFLSSYCLPSALPMGRPGPLVHEAARTMACAGAVRAVLEGAAAGDAPWLVVVARGVSVLSARPFVSVFAVACGRETLLSATT